MLRLAKYKDNMLDYSSAITFSSNIMRVCFFVFQQYLSIKLVVIKTILASDEATPSRELSSPLKVSRPIPW